VADRSEAGVFWRTPCIANNVEVIAMLWLAAAVHLAAPVAGSEQLPALRMQRQPRVELPRDPLRALPARAQARLDAVLEHLDVIGGGLAWKMRW
jgi:hypothetical protein